MALLINYIYRFGEFTLDVDQRILLRDGKPLPLTPKAFDTLLLLVENSGRIVDKEVLMKRLWPDTFVEETNLTFNIQQLRKTFGDEARHPRFIETVPRRGYRFIADVEEVLSAAGTVNEHITQRIEFADNEPADATLTRSSAGQPAPAAEQPAAKPAPVGGSRGIRNKALALAVALAVVLALGGFLFWKFVPLAKQQAGESGSGKSKVAPASPLKVEKLTDTGQSRQVAISPDGKYLAYTRDLKGKVSIWLRHLVTNTNIEIVTAGSFISELAFAHSGEYLYFVRSDPRALYCVSPLGGAPAKIVENLTNNFAISADDRQIAFIRPVIKPDDQRELSLLVANADGTGERTLLVAAQPEHLSAPVWTPDGSSIICAQGIAMGDKWNLGLIEVKVADGIKKELSPERFSSILKLDWLPDRSGLLMVAREHPGAGRNHKLWHVSYPGLEIRQLTEDSIDYVDLSVAAGADKAVASQATLIQEIWVGPSSEPQNLKKITQAIGAFCWTPDSRLVFSSTASGNEDIWIMQADGTEQRQLTNDPAVDLTPTITPDNRYIVFTSYRTGSSQVWRMNLDGSNQIPLAQGLSLAISPDGKWVLYNTMDNWHLWKVPIDGGEPVRLTEYLALRPAVSPDGKMIACLGRTGTKFELLLLPFAGGQPVKKIDFVPGPSRLLWTADAQALIYTTALNGVQTLVKQPVTGGQSQPMVSLGEDSIPDFGYSFDGQFLAVTRGGWHHDIVLISNLNRF